MFSSEKMVMMLTKIHDDANSDHDDEDEDDPDDHSGRALVSVRRLALSRQASFSLLLIESPMRLREA